MQHTTRRARLSLSRGGAPGTALPLALAALALGAGAARAEEAFSGDVVVGGRTLAGEVRVDEDGVSVRKDGWTVKVPHDQALAIRRPDGRVEAHAASRLEEQGLVHELRGRLPLALDAYDAALEKALAAGAAGALPAEQAAARAEVYLRRIHVFCDRLGRSEQAIAIMSRVIEDPRATPWVVDCARTWRAYHLPRLGRLDLAALEDQALGVLPAWYVVGPFDNERGGGFAQAYGPETAAFDPAGTFPGKKGQVAWRPVPVDAPPRGEVDLDELMAPNDQAAAYAITYLFAERATPVALRLGSDEAVKVWVNRTLVHSANARRPLRPDQDHIGVRLEPGWNEVLLKVCDQTGGWAFRLRVTAPAGGPAPGVRPATLAEVAAKPQVPAQAEKAPVHAGGIATLESMTTGSQAGDWRAWLHLGYLRYSTQAHDQGQHLDRQAVAAAVERRPDFAPLRLLLSHAERTPAEFSVNKEENARRQALEAAAKLDPEATEPALLLAQYYAYDLGIPERARQLVAPLVAARPDHLEARLLLLDLEEGRDRDALAAAEVERLMAEHEARVQREEAEGYPPALVRRALALAGARNDAGRQLQLMDLLLEVDQEDPATLRRQARLHRSAGRWDAADALLRRASLFSPFDRGVLIELGNLCEARGDLTGAAEQLDRVLALRPDDADHLHDRGTLAERAGQQAQADAFYERALQVNPNLVELRDYLEFRARKSEKSQPFEGPWTIDAAPLVAAAKSIPLDPRRSSRVLLRQTVAKLNLDGTTSEFTQEVVRVENEAGTRELAGWGAVYASDQRIKFQLARVHRKAGGVQDAPVGGAFGQQAGEHTQYQRYGVRLPPLDPGDVIEVRYRVDDLTQGFFGDYYGHIAYFQDDAAIDWIRYVLIAPKARKLHVNLKGLDAAKVHTRKEEGEQQVHVFETKGVPPLDPEPNQPWAKELLPQVQVSTFGDWDHFARWYWNLVKDQHEADEGIRAKVRELLKGAETAEEKVKRIYHYVVTDIRYSAAWEFGIHGFKPYNATQIYARKFGDCKDKATLINTMLREAGIQSWPVLIFGEDLRGKEDISLPLMTHFNHCISWVDLGEGGIFLDGTAEHHPYPTLPTMDYGARVVVITDKAGLVKEIPIHGPDWNGVKETHELKVREDGAAVMRSVIEGTGTFGVVLRSWMLTEGRRREVLEPKIGRAFSGASVKSVKTSDVRDLNAPVRVEVEVELPRVLQRGSGGALELQEVKSWLFDQLYLGGRSASALAADAERERDVVLQVPSGTEEVVTYELPPNHTVQSLPQPVDLQASFGTYVRSYHLEGGKLVLKRVLKLTTTRIPVAKYEEFRQWLSRIERAEAEKPLLKRGGGDQ